MTGTSNTESVGSVAWRGQELLLQPTTEPGETQELVEDRQPGLATTFSGTVTDHHVSPPHQGQTHMVQVEVNQATDYTSKGNGKADTVQPEQSQQPVTGDEEPPEALVSMYPSFAYITGLDVDSNPTETDHSDTDSAIGPSVYSSTFSTSSSVYDFVEENGRTYHRFKEGKYHLPNDEVSS